MNSKDIEPNNPMINSKPSIIDVANWFLSKKEMPYKRVSALCYLAQCHHIGYDDSSIPLFNDDFEAHVGRPTSVALLRLAEKNNYNFPVYTAELFGFTEDQLETLEMVWNSFGRLEEYDLDIASHDECFELVRSRYKILEPCTDIIPKDLIDAVYKYKIACMNLPEYEKYAQKLQEYTKS